MKGVHSVACFGTQLQEQINKVLENTCGYAVQCTPDKYYQYSKIRSELSKVMGKSRGIGIIEYEKAMVRLRDIQKQLEVSGAWK